MGTRVKPVQPTEIKDKKIVYQVIQEIRRKPTAAALKRLMLCFQQGVGFMWSLCANRLLKNYVKACIFFSLMTMFHGFMILIH